MAYLIKVNHLCFYELFACADVSYWMILFQVVST